MTPALVPCFALFQENERLLCEGLGVFSKWQLHTFRDRLFYPRRKWKFSENL